MRERKILSSSAFGAFRAEWMMMMMTNDHHHHYHYSCPRANLTEALSRKAKSLLVAGATDYRSHMC